MSAQDKLQASSEELQAALRELQAAGAAQALAFAPFLAGVAGPVDAAAINAYHVAMSRCESAAERMAVAIRLHAVATAEYRQADALSEAIRQGAKALGGDVK